CNTMSHPKRQRRPWASDAAGQPLVGRHVAIRERQKPQRKDVRTWLKARNEAIAISESRSRRRLSQSLKAPSATRSRSLQMPTRHKVKASAEAVLLRLKEQWAP